MKDYNKIPISYVCYILKIDDKEIYKIGMSNKLKARMRNLRVSFYENINCIKTFEFPCRKEALEFEKQLKIDSHEYHIRGEWYYHINSII